MEHVSKGADGRRLFTAEFKRAQVDRIGTRTRMRPEPSLRPSDRCTPAALRPPPLVSPAGEPVHPLLSHRRRPPGAPLPTRSSTLGTHLPPTGAQRAARPLTLGGPLSPPQPATVAPTHGQARESTAPPPRIPEIEQEGPAARSW